MEAKRVGDGGPVSLIYDGQCSLCQASVSWVRRNARPDAFEFIPCQSAERRARFPQVAEEECKRAMALVLPDGSVFAGSDGLRHILGRLKRWRWLAYAFAIPGVGLLARPGYSWVARHRYGLYRALR